MADEAKYTGSYESKFDEPCEAPAAAAVVVPKVEECAPEEVETSDRGLFGFGGKKKEEEVEKKCDDEEVIVSDFQEKVQVCDEAEKPKEEETKHESLIEKLKRSDSSSSSSSDEEEVDENGEKKKKKKGLKEKIKEKISGDKKEEEPSKAEEIKYEDKIKYEDTVVPVEKCDDVPEEKKGFLEKIKDKLPGGHKKTEEVAVVSHQTPPPPVVPAHDEHYGATPEVEGKEKKGFLDKIKEKLPGYHSKSDEEKEVKEKEIKEKVKEEEC